MDESSHTEVQRTTTTRTTISQSPHVEELKGTLRRIDEALVDAREEARREVERIESIRGLIDAESLAGLLSSITEMEDELVTLVNDRDAKAEDVQALAGELEAEKERLTKLWDAYKVQEEELRRMQRDEPLLKERLADRDRMISELEDEVNKLRSYEDYKERYQGLQRDHERLRASYKQMEDDMHKRNDEIVAMEAKMEKLQASEEDTRKLKDLEKKLAEEKERLAKLYKVYEDAESSLKTAEAEAARWREWYDRHRQAFEMVGGAAKYPVEVDDEQGSS